MIRVENIYYMLAYAFSELRERAYVSCAAEAFDNTADLLAEILVRGVFAQIRHGLGRDYREETETLGGVRGRIDMAASVKRMTMHKGQLVCTYDVFSEDRERNRILKTTMELLLRARIQEKRKRVLHSLLRYFRGVETLRLHEIRWNRRYDGSSRAYRMLLSICYLVVKGLLQTQADGTTKLMDFLDEQRMSRLYERFILEYFRREYPALSVRASQIPWVLDEGMGELLPVMQSDITLSYGNRVLIIDAKYYDRVMQTHFEVQRIRSVHLYQIFTYVKNRDAAFGDAPHEVSGMLLYAGTDEDVLPDHLYRMSGNVISVRTLQLNSAFGQIAEQLNGIANELLKSEDDK